MRSTLTLLLAAGSLAALIAPAPPPARAAETRTVVDAAGREVVVPARIARVFAAGPPATVLLYTLAPDAMLGWYRPLTLDERAYIPARYAELPTLRKLTGRTNVPDVDLVRIARADLILDYGTIAPAAVSLADRIQKETGVAYVMLDGSLSGIPRAYEMAGALLGVPERARMLADHAARVLAEVDARVARVPARERPRVYYARGPEGLQTEVTESIDRLGAVNVAEGRVERGALATVSLEQVREWNPDVIVAIDPAFAAGLRSDPRWQEVKAVRDGRIHLVPLLPFPWLDTPPSVNRLIGLLWLGRALYPGVFPDDLREETRTFYDRFYRRPLYEHEVRPLVGEGPRP